MADHPLEFPNAPVVEAVFDLGCAARVNGSHDSFRDAARKAVDQEEFPMMRSLMIADVQIAPEEKTGNPVTHSSSDWGGVEFRSKDEKLTLQFRRDGMSLHRLKPYTSFEDLLPLCRELWKQYTKVARPRSTTRQALRFINRIRLPEGACLSDIANYVKITPPFAEADGLAAENFLSRVQLVESGTGHRAYVSISIANLEPLELLFDIGTACGSQFDPKAVDIWEHMTQLQNLKNKIFTGSLHDTCLDLFR